MRSRFVRALPPSDEGAGELRVACAREEAKGQKPRRTGGSIDEFGEQRMSTRQLKYFDREEAQSADDLHQRDASQKVPARIVSRPRPSIPAGAGSIAEFTNSNPDATAASRNEPASNLHRLKCFALPIDQKVRYRSAALAGLRRNKEPREGALLSEDLLAGAAADVAKSLREGEPTTRLDDVARKRASMSAEELGNALLQSGRIDAAEAYYRAVLVSPVDRPWPLVGLARVMEKRGDSGATIAALRLCFDRFPALANPGWYVLLSRAEAASGDDGLAEITLSEGVARFPKSPRPAQQFAEFLGARGRNDEAIARWRALVRDFPDHVEPSWLVNLAARLRGAGLADEADAVVAQLAELFPLDPASLMYRAQHALSRQEWRKASTLSRQCLEQNPHAAKQEWFNICAFALLRGGSVAESLSLSKEARNRFPDSAPVARQLAITLQELGHWQEAESLWAELIRGGSEKPALNWHLQLLSCRRNQPLRCDLREAVKDFEEHFPDHPAGRLAVLQDCLARHAGFEEFSAETSAALARFPACRPLLANFHVPVLLGSGRASEARRLAAQLMSEQQDHFALLAQWNIGVDVNGESAIRESVQAAALQTWDMEPGLALCGWLIGLRSKWALMQARSLCENLLARFSTDLKLNRLYARILIELGEDERALEIVESLPDECRIKETLELRAWSAARIGSLERARAIWADILDNTYCSALHGSRPNLVPVSSADSDLAPNDVVAFCCVRNEMANLPGFLRHHRRLGIRRFVFIDNLSTDETGSFLRAQPDVVLHRTSDSFPEAGSGMRWINHLIEEHGLGRWCLFADADEDFIYPGWETVPVNRFAAWLDSEGAEAVGGMLLDLYPERIVDSQGSPAKREDCCFYDRQYDWLGLTRSPWRRAAGGIRYRLFGTECQLQKTPFLKGGRGSYLNNHETTPVRLSSVSAALLHFKCANLFAKAGQPCINREDAGYFPDLVPGCTRRYERYASASDRLLKFDLLDHALTRRLGNSLELVEHELMQAPAAYLDWLEGEKSNSARAVHRLGSSPDKVVGASAG